MINLTQSRTNLLWICLHCATIPTQLYAQSSLEKPGIYSSVHDDAAGNYTTSSSHCELLSPSGKAPTASVEAFIIEKLAKHQIPGATLAIAQNGSIVFSRGFGYADLEKQEPVHRDSRFRIASISKPITAAAILKLCEEGKLQLDSQVLSILDGYQPAIESGTEFDSRLSQITIRQLLQHRAGWDRGISGDPMFESRKIAQKLRVAPPASQADTIRYMLGKPLDFDPGERYAYSNFGYSLLGRVIEQLSGENYEAYVQKYILEPSGIAGIQLGRTLLRYRAAREVKYYDPGFGPSVFGSQGSPQVPDPYGVWNLEAMDAHGGWISSSIDLVKFGSAYYANPKTSRLSESSLRATLARPEGSAGHEDNGSPKQEYYGLGWKIYTGKTGDCENLTHLGSLPGSSTLLVCRTDGLCYALLCNSRTSPYTSHFCGDILLELMELMDQVTWPKTD